MSKRKSSTTGDYIVDGIFAGLWAGTAMLAYLVLAGWLAGDGPGVVLGRFGIGEAVTPVVGAFSHLATSSIYGALFGLLLHMTLRLGGRSVLGRVPLWGWGLLFGALLLAGAQYVILPATQSLLLEFNLFHLATGHLIYGLGLGVVFSRNA